MIPCAYFFVEEKLERYKNYSTTSSKYFTHEEVREMEENEKIKIEDKKNIINLFWIVRRHINFKYIFVIYNPDLKKLFMSKIGESSTLKVLIDTSEKENKLFNFYAMSQELYELASTAYVMSHSNLGSVVNNNNFNYDNEVKACDISLKKYQKDLKSLVDLCWLDFKNELAF